MSYGEGRLMLGTGGLSPGKLELLRPPSSRKECQRQALPSCLFHPIRQRLVC